MVARGDLSYENVMGPVSQPTRARVVLSPAAPRSIVPFTRVTTRSGAPLTVAARRTWFAVVAQAASVDRPDVLQFVIEAELNIEIDHPNDDGVSAMMLAANFGHLRIVHKLLEAAASDFMGRWEKGEVTRWQQGGAPPPAEVAVDLGRYGSAAELEALGLEILKGALTKHSLKAGGSLQQRAERCASARADGPPTLGGCPNHLHARDPTSHTWQPHAKPSWPPLPYIGYTCPADFSPSRLASPPSPCHPRS